MLVLDTDHLVELDRGGPPGAVLLRRLATADEEIATTIVSAEEQFRGWLAQIHRLTDVYRQILAYEEFGNRIRFFASWRVLSWTTEAADQFLELRARRLRVGTMDLKIAAIVMARQATLLSRNQVDFGKIAGLHVEDWTTEPRV